MRGPDGVSGESQQKLVRRSLASRNFYWDFYKNIHNIVPRTPAIPAATALLLAWRQFVRVFGFADLGQELTKLFDWRAGQSWPARYRSGDAAKRGG